MTQDIRHYMNILKEDVVPLRRSDRRTEDEKYDAAVAKQKSNPKKHLDVIRFYLDQDEYSSTENLIYDFVVEWYAGFSLIDQEAIQQFGLILDNPEFIELANKFEQKYGFDIIKDMVQTTAKKAGLQNDQ